MSRSTFTLILLAAVACARAPAPSPASPPTPPPPAAPAPPPAERPPGGPTTAVDYFPLAVGNSWTFVDRSPQHAQPTRHTVRIVGRDPDGYFVDDQRGALRADRDCLHDRVRRLLCRPFEVGNAWTSVVGDAATERYRIVAVDESVTVPAGTFRGCVRVRSQARSAGAEQIAEMTYAPGVGLVRLQTFAVVGGKTEPQVRGELEAYRLARPAR